MQDDSRGEETRPPPVPSAEDKTVVAVDAASEEDRTRFEVELEFVQCLANPFYVHYLAQTGYFADQAFVRYLDYLQYWKQPDYARFIVFPHCLFVLDMLQDAKFREAMAHAETATFLHHKQTLHWQWYRNSKQPTAGVGGQ
ncbi:suppressor of hpr1 [Sorochytrium milnesiophthora]